MRRWSPLILGPILAAASACTPPVNTVPEPVSPIAAIQYYDLDIPSDLEIKAVDFAATSFTDVTGVNGMTGSTVTGRAFVKVYAVQRGTGEQFLLLYEDVARRKRPVEVLHFRTSTEVILPGG
jgi:hypothetical protein